MSELLQGKVALVTGAGRGIGRAIAVRLGARGADVIVHDFSRDSNQDFGEGETIDEVAEMIRQLGGKSSVVTGDLTDTDAVARVVEHASTKFAPIDILVNNAGGDIAADGKSKAKPNDAFIQDADLVAILHRNLMTTMKVSRAVAQRMVAEGRPGRIINISSLAGLAATTHETTYGVAKAGIVHFTKCLSVQLREHGINVNAVAPGRIKSARWMATIETRPGMQELLGEMRPLLRLGEPEDVANIVEFFAGDLSKFVSGEVLRVDGGLQTTVGAGES